MLHGIVVCSLTKPLSTQSCTFVFLFDFQMHFCFKWKFEMLCLPLVYCNALTKTEKVAGTNALIVGVSKLLNGSKDCYSY